MRSQPEATHASASYATSEPTGRIEVAHRRHLWFLLVVAFAVRLCTLDAYPLTDNTEARYAEIARKMVETGQWIVPQIDYGVPFWGKPPLAMWLTALSYEVFGVSAFAARLPSLLLSAAVCLLVVRVGAWRGDADYGLRAAVVLATSLLVLISAGGVMTDLTMWFGTTLSMLAYWRVMSGPASRWRWLFFVGVAIGLLAKGPVATVLTLLPIGVWAIATRQVGQSVNRLPWISGSLLVAALVVPWYWAAELQSPGFLRYFIVGEHLQRFLVAGWSGDLYGVGHSYPRGTIALFALLAMLPWSIWLGWHLLRRRAVNALATIRSGDSWTLYLVCWTLAPVAFFAMSRNILPTYFLPGAVGFALLVAQAWLMRPQRSAATMFSVQALSIPALCVALAIVAKSRGVPSQQDIVDAYRQSLPQEAALIYFRQRPSSASFYSQGLAGQVDDAEELKRYLLRNPCVYVATEVGSLSLIPADLRRQLGEVVKSKSGKYALLHWRSDHAHINAARTTTEHVSRRPVVV